MSLRYRCSTLCTLGCAAWTLHCSPDTRATDPAITLPSADAMASFPDEHSGPTSAPTPSEAPSPNTTAVSSGASDSGADSHEPPATTERASSDAGVLAPDGTPKLDLLLVVDSSPSMGEKAQLFAGSVRGMLRKLIDPPCVDVDGRELDATDGECPDSSAPLHPPLRDIHVGVITTSLGAYSAVAPCTIDPENPDSAANNDGAHLVGSLARANGAGGGEFVSLEQNADVTQFEANVEAQVLAAGERGCGYEASLEAWVRFLVDPAPYTRIVRQPCSAQDSANNCNGPERGDDQIPLVDTELLAQRRAFLRPDSLVGIVILTDENDCSFRHTGQAWLAAEAPTTTGMFKGSAACASDPDDACCQICAVKAAAGCPATTDGHPTGCEEVTYPLPVGGEPSEDPLALRCYKQKQRFGVDFLFPVERYLTALTSTTVCSDMVTLTGCALPVPNPLLHASGYDRPLERVFVTTLTGLPWQDVAVDPGAEHLTVRSTVSTEDGAGIDWDLLLGRANASGVRPLYPTNDGTIDPLLYESIEPRTGAHPVLGVELQPPTAEFMSNPINGHERNIVNRDDLQFACIFPLSSPLPCPGEVAQGSVNTCECTIEGNEEWRSPLCQAPSGGYSLTQRFARATPGTRLHQAQQLLTTQGEGVQTVVGSICPKSTEPTAPDFAYLPTLDALRKMMAPQLQ